MMPKTINKCNAWMRTSIGVAALTIAATTTIDQHLWGQLHLWERCTPLNADAI